MPGFVIRQRQRLEKWLDGNDPRKIYVALNVEVYPFIDAEMMNEKLKQKKYIFFLIAQRFVIPLPLRKDHVRAIITIQKLNRTRFQDDTGEIGTMSRLFQKVSVRTCLKARQLPRIPRCDPHGRRY